MIRRNQVNQRTVRIKTRAKWYQAEHWLGIFLLIQKRFQWCDNVVLTDEIERYRVVVETAQARNPFREALLDEDVQWQKMVVSQHMLKLLHERRASREATVQGKVS